MGTERSYRKTGVAWCGVGVCVALLLLLATHRAGAQSPRVIEVVAGSDSSYRIAGKKDPVITVRAGEAIALRITAIKGSDQNRNGAVHSFSLIRAKDRSPVPGWDFELKPGVQEFAPTAPAVPGEYIVVCTVICGPGHEAMHMQFVVLP